MDTQQQQVLQNTENLKDIPKWTRRYAQNRTLTILVLMAMITLCGMLFAFILTFLLAFAAVSFKKGNMLLGYVGIAVLVAGLAVTAKYYIAFLKKYGGKNRGLIDQIIDRKVYGKEGFAATPEQISPVKNRPRDIVISIAYMVLLLGTMNLGMSGRIPIKYVLPVMAIFVVPFNLYLYFAQQIRLGPVFLICPILYAIHAILILMGLPVYFTGPYAVLLNLILPNLYTFLACIIGHLYSRYALKKLKTAVNLQEKNNG